MLARLRGLTIQFKSRPYIYSSRCRAEVPTIFMRGTLGNVSSSGRVALRTCHEPVQLIQCLVSALSGHVFREVSSVSAGNLMLRVDVPGIGESGVSTITDVTLCCVNQGVFGHTFFVSESLYWSPAIISESMWLIFGSTLFAHHQTHTVCTYGQKWTNQPTN